ncbi:AfsR family transcriptional regulator [Mangrovactinospora gilvigrisea]|uniref:AfsR family transcriptional regulator n=1 Tax=Mangrovactinospora gilvigrisea TaxID=1428644 RepID=A0A1J7C9C4_9ACTN|nr:BTAD domain-containing putative transcriptional regulator [Mangrovactinospora gilvigrisea]OIV38136.1 AfsR family transcriptional regulator [Mangrovactinospora gilvigrisea]
MEGEGTGLRFAALGPVRAWRDGEPRAAGSPQQRAVLAVLLLRTGRTATTQELVDAVWGEDAPSGAVATLRTYAFRLRKELGPDVFASEAGGYRLRFETHQLDLARAEARADEAERARDGGDPAKARELLGAALEEWEGETLAGVPGPYAEAQRSRLEEWRLNLLEVRLELDVELGRHAEVVAELTALSSANPLRERLRGLLMLALYRSGRQAEALGVYADTRRLLADELGVDPGPELSELHQRILEGDEELAPAGGFGAKAGRPVLRPAQLPSAVADFTGRALYVRELTARMVGEGIEDGAHALAISAVAGIGGVGKTTLAVHVAHQVRESFPDGQLYIDLQGQGIRPPQPESVLASFLRALGIPDAELPDSEGERSALFRSVLADRRVLVVLDDAKDAAQVRPLLPGAPGCAVIVTSRARLAELPGVYQVALDAMSAAEALEFFGRIVGAERIAAERAAALEVVHACGRLPLAIRIAGSRLAARPGWSVASLARRLRDEHRRLDHLRVGDLAVTATFELGYRHLEELQARAFRLLALPDGPDVSVPAAGAVLELDDPFEVEDLLDGLVDIAMLESPTEGRYRYHDLLRLYARRKAAEQDPKPERRASLVRLTDHYLATARDAYRLENPGDRLVEHLVETSQPGLHLDEPEEGRDWLYEEAECLLAAVRQAAEAGGRLLTCAADLLQVTQDLGDSGGYAREYESAARGVADQASAAGDTRAEGRARGMLGQAMQMEGRFDEAVTEAGRVLESGSDDPVALEAAYSLLGSVALYRQELDSAGRHFTAALEVGERDDNPLTVAVALGNLSRVYLAVGEAERAVESSRRVVALQQDLRSSLQLGIAQYNLGLALSAVDDHDAALEALRTALDLFRLTRQRLWEGMTVFRMAEIHASSEDDRTAVELAEQALVLLKEIGGDWRRGLVLALLGDALHRLGHADRARACRTDALRVFDELGAAEADDVRAALAAATAVPEGR